MSNYFDHQLSLLLLLQVKRRGLFAGQPLFDCVDKVALMEGVNELMVTCRVISTHSSLNATRVHVYTADKNFTVDAQLPQLPTDYPYPADSRYVVRVEPKPTTVRIKAKFHYAS